MVVDRKRLAELIEDAKQEWRDNPDVSAKLLNLVDLLCKEEQQDSENEAVKTLDAEFAKSENYSFKMRADDIRMKQTRRKVRRVAADGDKKAVKAARLEQVRQRLSIYEERVKKYPTEHKLKYDYGKQLMLVGKYDEAIPLLQAARNDPKSRIQCMNLIARCFYEKGFYTQAISQYNQAIQDYELAGDDLSKELYYWLGRTHEKNESGPDAEKAYGQLIQWDYNYRDVRQRLADLEQGQADQG
jgi:tetratricopeptide (TPR) repeat protein